MLHALPELPVDFASAAWLIARRSMAMPVFQAECVLQSGDRPAAAYSFFPAKPQLLFYVIEMLQQSSKPWRNSCTIRANTWPLESVRTPAKTNQL
jgi:hypothetical protein